MLLSRRPDLLTLVPLRERVDEDGIKPSLSGFKETLEPLSRRKVLPSPLEHSHVRPVVHARIAHVLKYLGMRLDDDVRPRLGRLEEPVDDAESISDVED